MLEEAGREVGPIDLHSADVWRQALAGQVEDGDDVAMRMRCVKGINVDLPGCEARVVRGMESDCRASLAYVSGRSRGCVKRATRHHPDIE